MSHEREGWSADRDLFSRDDHVTMLSFDRWQAGELDDRTSDLVLEHVGDCNVCSARWGFLQQEAPLRAAKRSSRTRTPRGMMWATAAISVGLAAGLLLVLWPKPYALTRDLPDEGSLTAASYTTTTDLDVIALDAVPFVMKAFAEQRTLFDEDRVAWDDQVRVEVEFAMAGFTAVVHREPILDSDAAEGTGGEGPSPDVGILRDVQAVVGGQSMTVVHEAEPGRRGLPEREQLFVIWCRDHFGDHLGESDLDPDLLVEQGGCVVQALTLLRYGQASDS